jgi:hypothetical protein
METALGALLPEEFDQGVDLFVLFHLFPDEELKQKQAVAEEVAVALGEQAASRVPAEEEEEELRSINLMYHAWCFPDLVPSLEAVGHCELDVGVFDAHNVAPVRSVLDEARAEAEGTVQPNLQGGAPFDRVAPRQCVVHELNFSPCNLQLRLDASLEPDLPCHCFYSVCRRRAARPPYARYAISYHVLPSSMDAQRRLLEVAGAAHTPRELVAALHSEAAFRTVAAQLSSFLGGA